MEYYTYAILVYYFVEFVRYYAGYNNYIVFSFSSGGGIALWASAADAHLFIICPVPD